MGNGVNPNLLGGTKDGDRRQAPESRGGVAGKGTPSPVWGWRGYAVGKFFEILHAILHILGFFGVVSISRQYHAKILEWRKDTLAPVFYCGNCPLGSTPL